MLAVLLALTGSVKFEGPVWSYREEILGPKLASSAFFTFLYRSTTDPRYQKDDLIGSTYIMEKGGYLSSSVTDGDHFGVPCRLIKRRYVRLQKNQPAGEWNETIYVTTDGKPLRLTVKRGPETATVLFGDDVWTVQVSDSRGNRDFERDAVPGDPPFAEIVSKGEKAEKKTWWYDPFENVVSRFTVRRGGTMTGKYAGKKFTGPTYEVVVGDEVRRVALTPQDFVANVRFSDEWNLEPDN